MKPYTIAVGILLIVIVVAHALAPDPYSWTQHTMSQLGAQAYQYAYIMRFGFVTYGVLLFLGSTWRVAKAPRQAWPHVFIGIYGVAILLTGFFSASPFIPGVPFSAEEANLHSNLATIAGIAISAGMLFVAMREPARVRRIFHLLALVLTTLISGAFFMFASSEGVFQRLLWVVGFAWLVFLELPTLGESKRIAVSSSN